MRKMSDELLVHIPRHRQIGEAEEQGSNGPQSKDWTEHHQKDLTLTGGGDVGGHCPSAELWISRIFVRPLLPFFQVRIPH